jgi:pimeloyl-ACP methyl ester carboxylesterase
VLVPDLTGGETVGDMAAGVLHEVSGDFALAGLSMGGYVAFEILRRAPERVNRVALINTRAEVDTEAESRRRRGLIELARKGRFKGVTPRLLPSLLHPEHLHHERITRTVTDMAERVGQAAFVRQQTAIINRPDSQPLLSSIRQPALVLGGDADAIAPPVSHEAMARAMPNARLMILARCGHLAPLERPGLVTAVFRAWLADAPLPADPLVHPR